MVGLPNNKEYDGSLINFLEILRGTLGALVVSFSGSVFLGAGLYFTNLAEGILPWFSAGLFFFSVLVGAWLAAYRAGKGGLWHGLGVALLFCLFSFLLTATVLPVPLLPTSSLVQKLVLAAAAGVLGGMLGVGSSH